MYELIIDDYFSAAHNLKDYKGNCEHLHGHNWKVQVIVQVNELDSTGLGIDFRELKKILKETLSLVDHKYLNELEPFRRNNPTTEYISKFLFMDLKEKLNEHKNIRLKKVLSWEENDAGAAFYED